MIGKSRQKHTTCILRCTSKFEKHWIQLNLMCIYKQPELISSMFVLWRDVRPVRLWHWWISWVGRFHIGIFSHCRVTWISIAFWELYLFIVNGSRASPFPRLSRPTGDVTSASRVPCSFRPWYDYNNIFPHPHSSRNIFYFYFWKKHEYTVQESAWSQKLCAWNAQLWSRTPLNCWSGKNAEHINHLTWSIEGTWSILYWVQLRNR